MDRDFHRHVFSLRPKQTTKPTTFWVAVLKLAVKPSSNNVEEDFLWIKCHGEIKASVIRAQYEQKNPIDGKVFLKLDNLIVGHQTMRSMDLFKDQLVVFEVFKPCDEPPQSIRGRSPLRPMNTQIKSPPPNPNTTPTLKDLPSNIPGATFQISTPISGGQDENLNPQPSLQPPASRPQPQPTTASIASIFPKVERFTPSSVVTPRPDWATSKGFSLYEAQTREKMATKWSTLNSAQIQNLILDTWLKFSSLERQHYEDRAKEDAVTRNVKLEPIKAELKVKDLLPIETQDAPKEAFQLQKLLTDATPELLETSVEEGVRLLDQLKGQMLTDSATSKDATQWIQQIDHLRKQAVKTRTVIGVVGNTGAGKSSVINAMLDQERLLPTNCMRACTAVVTEVSYNDGEIPYRAKIEFIKSADWEKELKTLFQDLVDSNGNVSRESSNPDTDAGIAYAKIKAVYPKKTRETIPQTSIEKMLEEVSHILGTSREIEESDSLRFYQRLQHFVDSKEKSTGDKQKDKKKERREMEYWPLIRVVRIYVKSPALSTGAVIVDLPGVHDSNAARAAVAENYMKECTGLWIVAPINRAVDDKAAKSLLGESFKRQLKMDGGFSTVTFICSKTDDISLMEAQESLGLDEEMGDFWLEKEEFGKKAKSLSKELDELKESRIVYSETYNDADEQIDVWETLKSSIEDGKTCFAPRARGSKKKRKSTVNHKGRKKQRRSREDDSFDEDSEDSEVSNEDEQDSSENEESREPLTEEQVNSKLVELRETKKEARSQKGELTDKMAVLKREILEVTTSEKKIEAKMSALCISGRNQYSKGAIQHDFAAGIKELDQELAADEDEENFDPECELRDYDEVARSLPVFCVSSRGYQKLQGRLRKDPNVPGFEKIEETEIPQLQAHCKQLTGKGRVANCQRFVNNLSQLLNSLAMWASNDGSGANMTPEQKAREERYLQKGLKGLESGLDKVVRATQADLEEEFQENIFDKYDSGIAAATGQADKIALKWGSRVNHENRAEGGYCWSTYKAICRRMGVYSNAQGPHEWNRELIEPMMKLLVSGWEKTFSRRLPLVMTVFTRESSKLLTEFHRDVNSRASNVGAGLAGLRMLQQQLGVYENIIKDLANTVKTNINTTQKDINREFTPVIERAMTAAYDACVAEAGPGSYVRMKAAMHAHVDQERHVMFQQSADEAKRRLTEMLEAASMTMSDRIDEVFVAMRRDYRSVLGGGDAQGEILPKSQRLLRKQVMTTLDGVEQLFKIALGQATDDDGNAEVRVKKLEENGNDQDLDEADSALFQQMATNDTANRQFKSEEGESEDVSMNDVAGHTSRSEEKAVPNDQVSTIHHSPQTSNDNFPASTAQENMTREPIFEHREDAHTDWSKPGKPEPPQEQGGTTIANSSYQEEYLNNSTGFHEDEDEDEDEDGDGDENETENENENEDDEEELATAGDPSEEEMDSFESFPHSHGWGSF